MGSSSFAVVLAVAGASAALGGCAGSYPRLSFAVEQRIVRETTFDDLPAGMASPDDTVVRVMATGRAAGACSGALIGPRHVLTAQHCVVRTDEHRELTMRPLKAGELHVELGGGYLPWGRVAVREVVPCKGYVHDVDHDVAVLVLSQAVPRDVPTFELSYDEPREAAVYALAGFGTDVKPRVVPFTSWGVSTVTRHLHRGPVLAVADRSLAVAIDGAPGDSGGPILDTSTGRVVGVVSRGVTKAVNATDRGVPYDEGQPLVTGPRLGTCKAAITAALTR